MQQIQDRAAMQGRRGSDLGPILDGGTSDFYMDPQCETFVHHQQN